LKEEGVQEPVTESGAHKNLWEHLQSKIQFKTCWRRRAGGRKGIREAAINPAEWPLSEPETDGKRNLLTKNYGD